MNTVQRARLGLTIFFGLLIPLSVLAELQIIRSGMSPTNALLLLWTPGLCAIVTRLVMREGFADVSLRLGRGLRAPLIAVLYPFAVGALAYGIAWSTGLAELSPALRHEHLEIAIPGGTPGVRFTVLALFALLLHPLVYAIPALGEELGWRGYLLLRLMDARVPRPVLVCSLIWGAWHTPLILSGRYVSTPVPLMSAGIFLLTAISVGYLAARLRLETGSLWPVVLLHASWNGAIVAFFSASTKGPTAIYWVGETGVLVAGSAALVAFALVRGRWIARRSPADPAPRQIEAAAL